MDDVMTIDTLYDMFVAERKAVFEEWCGYDYREGESLKIGDHGTAAMCRKNIKRLEKRHKEITKILNEILRMETKWQREKDSA
jgi:hypothetical protein